MASVHRYAARIVWSGSTGLGYGAYGREHDLVMLPGADGGASGVETIHPGPAPDGHHLRLSADPAFGGRPEHPNPEQLVLAAAASCQLLSFLAVAARARIDVVAYEDDATAEMDEADPPLRLTAIALRPRVTLGADGRAVSEDRVARLLETAHRECFVARSLDTPVTLAPSVVPAG